MKQLPRLLRFPNLLIAGGLLGWLALPFLWHSAFLETKSHLDESTERLVQVCKAHGQEIEMDREPWYSCIKGFTSSYAYRIRNRYILPLGIAWLAIGGGLGAALCKNKRASNQASHANSDPALGGPSSALEG